MITCELCRKSGVDPPSQIADEDAAIAARWLQRLDDQRMSATDQF